MYILIIFSLASGFLLQTTPDLLTKLSSPQAFYIGMAGALAAIGISLRQLRHQRLCGDLFACCCLLIWGNYWPSFFTHDTPLFFCYLLYFVFIASLVELMLILPSDRIDAENRQLLKSLEQRTPFQPWMIMSAVLGSLGLPEHYLLFPITLTFLMLRLALFTYRHES